MVGISRDVLERARSSRDPRFDGKFFVAVLSTGIYCRPICPVRLSVAVEYYATAAAAAEAGFRPCLRCRPEAAPGSPAWIGTSAVVRRTLRLINEGALDTGSVKDLADRIGMGTRHLNRLLVNQIGASPVTIAQTRRLHFAKRLLDETNLRATDIALAAGYGSVRRFNEAFKSTYKKSPTQLRKRHARGAQEVGEITLKLSFRPPYDWNEVLSYLAERAIPGLESVGVDGYTRCLRIASDPIVVRIGACKDEHALQMQVRGAPPGELFELSSRARRVFDLTADPAHIADVFLADRLLAPLAMHRPGLRIVGAWDPFECAVRTLLERQIGLSAARAATAALVARSGQRLAGDMGGLTHLFPSATVVAVADLSYLPLSSVQQDTLRALCFVARDRVIGFSDTSETISAMLAAVEGIDDWVVQVVALRACGEPDAFPAQDLTLRFQAAHNTAPLSTRALEERAQPWRPWRGYAACQLWAESRRRSLGDERPITARSA